MSVLRFMVKKAQEKTSTPKHAVIATGGKQYLVTEGQKLRIEKLETEQGQKVVFDSVLMTVNGEKTIIGQPMVKDATVEAVVVQHTRAEKVVGAKQKAKKRYIRYFGHKQHLTEVEITKITA